MMSKSMRFYGREELINTRIGQTRVPWLTETRASDEPQCTLYDIRNQRADKMLLIVLGLGKLIVHKDSAGADNQLDLRAG